MSGGFGGRSGGRIAPMLATTGLLPPTREEHRWAFEMKWDGVRAVAYADGGVVSFWSRNDKDVTAGYPELTAVPSSLAARSVVLDGEIVAFDEDGRPSFELLQQRMHLRDARRVRDLAASVPVAYLVFDLLVRDGTALISRSYEERRRALGALDLAGSRWQVPPAFEGDGAAALAASRERRLEGVVAKRLASGYHPGRRSTDWLKVKHQRMQEVVICGWEPGEGRRAGGIGALVLGVYDAGKLVYAGQVGTGFTQRVLADLGARLRPLARKTSPFDTPLAARDSRGVCWVTPRLVGEVTFGEWTRDGRLRHPVWRGLRPDKEPADVVREG